MNGKRKQKWFGGYRTKSEAKKAEMRISAEIEGNQFIDSEKITIGQYMNDWYENHALRNLKKSTCDGYRIIIDKRIIPHIGNIQLSELTPYVIQQFYNKLSKEGRADGNGGLSNKSILQTHRVLSKALSQAYKLQIINKDPTDFVEIPKISKYYAQILHEDEIPTFLELFRETDIYIPVVLALTLGLRRGEVLGLKWQDIDFKNKIITINQNLIHGNKGYSFSTPKSDNSHRSILISDKLIEELLVFKSKQDLLKIKYEKIYNDYDLINCCKDGSPINPSTFSHLFSDVLRNNNFKHIRFHDLRHTNATLMLKHNIPAKVASKRLGHSTVGITLDLYSHVTSEMEQNVVNVMDQIIK